MNGLFIGEGTLLVQCAEEFRRAGGTITGILSQEPRVRAWAKTEGLTLFDRPNDEKLEGLAFDYLFSIVNLEIFPNHLPTQPKSFAINFFDGPLPKYTGVNITSWALMRGETEHSISWHELKETADEGRILKSRAVAIAANETSMSLNAKCYEAGLASFVELVQELKMGRLNLLNRKVKATGMIVRGDQIFLGRWILPSRHNHWINWFGDWILIRMQIHWEFRKSGRVNR